MNSAKQYPTFLIWINFMSGWKANARSEKTGKRRRKRLKVYKNAA